ncbi:hypothetical protein T484DRAFT_1923526 [Baffinella frigidus]|nr:hypothetical protein T484DRAFT_1923526 [Cryptophyta sp. CCMP2293]
MATSESLGGDGGGAAGGGGGAEGDHRASIFDFFRSHTAYDMLPESGRVVLLDANVPAAAAFSIMAANEQLAAPVWDSNTDRYLGMLTPMDMMEQILHCCREDCGMDCQTAMNSRDLNHLMTACPRPAGCPEATVDLRPDDDLMCVLRTFIRHDCRVLPVMDKEGTTQQLTPPLVGQVSRLLLFRFLYPPPPEYLRTLEGTLEDVGIGTHGRDKLVTAKIGDPVVDVMALMSRHSISGIPIIDDAGRLIDIYTDVDVLALVHFKVDIDVGQALEQARAGQVKTEQTCRTKDPLSEVVATFSKAKTTRLACLDDDGVVTGMLTLVDLFKFLAGKS